MRRHAASPRADQLLLLNLALQLFDGAATYLGFPVWGEANPLIRGLMTHLGVGLALAMVKLYACASLVFIWVAGTERLAVGCMLASAAIYGLLSFVPWLGAFWIQWYVA